MNELDSLAHYRLSNWKYSSDAQIMDKTPEELSTPTLDLNSCKSMNYQTRIYVDSCWIRTTLTIPKTIMGQAVIGSMKLLLSVDDYGYLWVNGQAKGHFPWDAEFLLSENAQPGMQFVILIKAMNTGGPLRLLLAELELERKM